MKIGVFDSGFGGLSVFKAIKKTLPAYDYVYLGDSARAPYGNYSHEVIYRYVVEAVEYLFKEQECNLVILACNTASAQALRRLQQEWLPASPYADRRVLGVIRPIAEFIAAGEQGIGVGKKVGVIGTRATIEAGVYKKEIEKQAGKKIKVLEKACPLLVPMIEEGFHKRPEMKRILRYYLRPLKSAGVQVLINGCTHYELLHESIKAIMGKRVILLESPQIVADSLQKYLLRHPEIETKLSQTGGIKFLTTGNVQRFNELGGKFWGAGLKAERVSL